MGIIFLTKPCHADRKNKGILTGKNVHPLFPLLFCAAEGKGGLQRGEEGGGAGQEPSSPFANIGTEIPGEQNTPASSSTKRG